MSYFTKRDRWLTRAIEWVLFAMAWSFRWITWPLSTWRLLKLVSPIGGILVMAIPSFRRRAMDNLALVWPDRSAEHRRITRQAAVHALALMLEYARLDRWLRQTVLVVDGETHLRDRPKGEGAILVTAHFGNWEAARMAARQMGHESGIIYRAFNNRYLDRFTMNLIPAVGEPVLQKGGGMRKLFAHVARGGVVMILVDQRNSGAPFVDFLGHPAETVLAAAELAERTGARLIPCVAIRDLRAEVFRVTFEPPVKGETPLESMTKVNARISAWIERTPEQWFWFHRRWRTTGRSRNVGPDREPEDVT